MLRLDLRDGTSLGITDHDKDIDFDLGDGSITYEARTGVSPSDVTLSTGFDVSNYEAQGPLGDMFTRAAVLGGRLDNARARLFQVTWQSLADGAIKIMAGNTREIRVEGGKFVFQVRSDIDRLNQTVGRLITPYCDADFGDARCGITPESIVGTVVGVTDEAEFTVSFAGAYIDDYFNWGTVQGLTGVMAGTAEVEILDWSAAGSILLFAPLSDLPDIGDTFTIKRGCSRLRKSDDVTVPTCMSYSNIVNFRGFPEVPGTDQALKMAEPSGN